MILDKNRVFDGWDNLAAGMDAGRRPSLIEPNQCSVARDAVFRGGVPKTRPGIAKLTLDFEEEIFYNPAGDQIGAAVVTDGIIGAQGGINIFQSQTAMFTSLDVGSVVTVVGFTLPPFTTITSITSASQAVLSGATLATHANNLTVTIVGRTNPVTFLALGLSNHDISSITANFTVADVGHPVTGAGIPAGTFITAVISPTLAQMSASVTAANVTLTMSDRNPNNSSTLAFSNEPFQCASYYVPANLRECIMATFGGRLFQITPGNGSAKVREIALGTEPTAENADFANGVSNSTTTFTSSTANFTSSDIGKTITGTNITGGTIISSVTNSTTIILSQAAFATGSALRFSIHGRTIIPHGKRNRRTIPENWMVQADKWHITQDGESKPIIFDGVEARRATEDEVIVGKIMAYGIGRLIVTRGRQIYFGDLFGSHEGDPSDSVLKFTETNFLNEGFPAEIPYTQGEITGASFFPSQDTATGQGELVIFTDRGAVSFDLHLAREQWKNSIFQQIALLNSSARGNRAITMVNSDLWIRSDEGWRAYRQARAQTTGWYQLPQSTEVSLWTNADTANLLRYGSAISSDNRLLATCNPVPNQGRLYHDGILSLDFDVLSSFGQATRPAWDGHWSKLRTLQLVAGTFAGKHRAFALGLDEDDMTQLYEILPDAREDFDGPITSEIEFRSHNFDSPFNEKNLYGADIWVDEIGPTPVTLDLSFRPDSSNDYLAWKTIEDIRPPGICGEITCGMVPTIGNGFAPRLKIGKPKDDCDDYSGRLIRRGFEFQPKLRWTGHAAIRRMRLQAMQEEEDSKGEC